MTTMNRGRQPHSHGTTNCRAVRKACKQLRAETDIPSHVEGMKKPQFQQWFSGACQSLKISGRTRNRVKQLIGL